MGLATDAQNSGFEVMSGTRTKTDIALNAAFLAVRSALHFTKNGALYAALKLNGGQGDDHQPVANSFPLPSANKRPNQNEESRRVSIVGTACRRPDPQFQEGRRETVLPRGSAELPNSSARYSSESVVRRRGPRHRGIRRYAGSDSRPCGGNASACRLKCQHRILANCQFDSVIGSAARRVRKSMGTAAFMRSGLIP